MKHLFTLGLLASALNLAYAQSTEVTQNAAQTARELKVKCQKLKIAKNSCVIAHFDHSEYGSVIPVQKPAKMYRVLNGKNNSAQYVATDYFKNGQQQASTFATSYADALLSSDELTELGVNQKNYTLWNDEGRKLQEIQELKNGKPHGAVTQFYDNGQKSYELNYDNGVVNGAGTTWHINGQTDSKHHYKQGEPNGAALTWYENGAKKSEGNYRDGRREGKWLDYYENGQIASDAQYQNDELNGTYTNYNENGQKLLEGYFVNGLRDGKHMYWFMNGQKSSESNYKNDVDDGKRTAWYDNGQKQSEDNYKDGLRDGKQIFWYENGQKEREENYKDGLRDGKQIVWHENGQKIREENYKNEVPDGKDRTWGATGELISETKYDNGEEVFDQNYRPYPAADAAKVAAGAAVDAAKAAHVLSSDEYVGAFDADTAAEELNTTCQTYKRADQCVIAYFDKNEQMQDTRKNAKFYRVLYGRVNYLFVVQDFHSNGKKQSNVYFSRGYSSLLNSFANSDLEIHGTVKGYDAKGDLDFSEEYQNGSNVNAIDAVEPAEPAAPPSADYGDIDQRAVDAARAGAAAVKEEVMR